MASVFISYSRADVDFVRRLSDALSRSGYTAWMDLQSIPPSAEWLQEIQAGIEGADAFLAVLSPDYLASSTCREEVQHAVEMKKRIIPLVRRDVDASAVPTELAALNWIFFREGDAFEEALEKLTFALETDLAYWHNSARLLTRALEWKARRQDVSRVLRGAELTEAERWLVVGAGKKPTPTALQTEFITWSRRAATRRQRTLTVALAVGLLLTLGLSIFSFVQYRSATSEAQTLRAQAIAGDADAALLANRLDQALLLGVEAVRHDNTLQARTTLFRALETGAYVSTVLQSGSQRVPSQYALLAGFSADGRTVASATSGGHVTVWDVPSRQVRSQFDVACHPLSGAALSADGGLVATLGAEVGNACQPQGVDVWDGRTGRPVQHLAEPTMLPGVVGINSVPLAFGPSGTLLAMAACEDAQCGAAFVDVWDASSGVRQQRLPLDGPNARMVSIAFSPDGNLLAANECSDICHVVVWTVSNGARLYSFPRADAAHPDWSVGAIAFGHHSALLAVAGGPASTNQGAILFLDARTGSPTGQPVFQNGGSISSMDFSPDDSLLVTNTLGTANLQLWEVATGDPASPPLVGHADPATRVMFSPVGLVFASSGYDGSVLLWRTKPLSDHTLTPGSGPQPQRRGMGRILRR